MKLNFHAICPKCSQKQRFIALAISSENSALAYDIFHHDEWKTFCFHAFSVATYCDNCKNYVTANISINNDKITQESTLESYANKTLTLSENEDIIIDFDIPPIDPPQYFESPLVTSPYDLLTQAKSCFKISAWDAVGIVCRKIIDIETQKIWRINNPYNTDKTDKENEMPSLAKRLENLLIPEIRDNKKKRKDIDRNDVYKHIDVEKLEHHLFYIADSLREEGNSAAHDILAIGQDAAEHAIICAELCLDLLDKHKRNPNNK